MQRRLFCAVAKACVDDSIVSSNEILSRANLHRHAMRTLLQGELYRDRTHPVYNFLFTYYHFNPKVLYQYSPGIGERLLVTPYLKNQGIIPERGLQWIGAEIYEVNPAELTVVAPQLAAMRNTLRILRNVRERRPVLSCFGLHEWAMLYRMHDDSGISRKQALPLRVSQQELDDVVSSHRLRCTHFDAFRFFTSDAKTRNAIPEKSSDGSRHMSRAFQAELEQPGCIHVHMDLFKWAVKLFPFVSSQLLLDTLSLAITARDIDMRASPYDLSYYYSQKQCKDTRFTATPIAIETPHGKAEYVALQQKLMEQSQPLREQLIHVYTEVIDKITCISSR